MIFVTGDMHGDMARFDDKRLNTLRPGDTLIVCGDFGFIWDGSKKESKQLQAISKNKFTTVFVDGTHENFDLLERFPAVEWNGGRVHRIAHNILHLCRGHIFNIDGISIFAMGGGENEDLEIRQSKGEKWWAQECPSSQEMQFAVDNLYENGLRVDYVITHEPPSKIKYLLNPNGGFNPVTAFFDELSRECSYRHWFFGSTHQDKTVSSMHTSVFQSIVQIDNPRKKI